MRLSIAVGLGLVTSWLTIAAAADFRALRSDLPNVSVRDYLAVRLDQARRYATSDKSDQTVSLQGDSTIQSISAGELIWQGIASQHPVLNRP